MDAGTARDAVGDGHSGGRRVNINAEALALIKEFEGCELTAYQDGGGVWTIGYGTTAAAGLGIAPARGMTITQKEAERLLVVGLNKFGASIRPKITAPINGNEWGAFLSLAYNIGPGAFAKSSALRKFNAGDKTGAADAILLWNKDNGKVVRGLTRRREAERWLFLSPVAAPQVTTKPIVVSEGPAQVRQSWLALITKALAAMFRKGD